MPAAFECDAQWLGRDAFLLDPRLGLWGGEQHPPAGATAFGIFMDRARDRWGRVLLERRETLASQREDRPQLPLFEMDFLLGVNDFTRVGGLRFRQGPGAPLLDDGLLDHVVVAQRVAVVDTGFRVEEQVGHRREARVRVGGKLGRADPGVVHAEDRVKRLAIGAIGAQRGCAEMAAEVHRPQTDDSGAGGVLP